MSSLPLPDSGGSWSRLLRELIALRLEPSPLEGLETLADWWPAALKRLEPWTSPIDRTLMGGFLADRAGFAFAAAIQAALRRLVPELPLEPLAALCITEEGGGHPRAIRSTLTPVPGGGWSLSGTKQYVTLGPNAEVLLVAASTGVSADGMNQIRLVRISSRAPGVSVMPMPLAVVPEIQHGRMVLEQVAVGEEDFLPGDGYLQYIKPFRTVEDLHVSAALLGHMLRVSYRFAWPREVQEELLALMTTLYPLAGADPSAPEVHIALGGFFTIQERFLETVAPCWAQVDAVVRERWERDSALRLIAGKARALRLETAWKRVG